MPLPWKKPRVTRISRLVADLQQSPKRGGSLVVETGFPTSLIDLFVKNRDRLKKPSKRKPSRQIQTPTSPSSSPRSSPSATPLRSFNSGHEVEDKRVEEVVEVDKECSAGGAVGGTVCDGDRRSGGSASSTVLKVCVVVALGLGSTKAALGVMIAAFLLLYAEYVGTRFLCFLKPCPESRVAFLDSWVEKGLLILKRWERSTKESGVQEETELGSNCVEEIQVVESNFDERSGSLNGSMPLDSETELSSEKGERIEVLIRNEQTWKGKIRSNFIKKFVPKKLRNGKKESKSNEKIESIEPEVSRNDKIGEIGEEVMNKSKKQEQEVKEERRRGLKERGACVSAKKEEKKGKSGHLILLAIVLVGLIGGRGIAFALTVSWCFMIRFVGRGRQIRCPEVGIAPIPS